MRGGSRFSSTSLGSGLGSCSAIKGTEALISCSVLGRDCGGLDAFEGNSSISFFFFLE